MMRQRVHTPSFGIIDLEETDMTQHPTIAFYTLGCKVNQYDTIVLEAAFLSRGYQQVDHRQPADVYVINSCSVTARSEAKARQAVRRFRRLHPEAIIALVGCYVQANRWEAGQLDQADILVGTGTPGQVVKEVERALGRAHDARSFSVPLQNLVHASGRSRAQLKIQDGCDAYCTYCIVPLARGEIKSRPLNEVVAHARALRQEGYGEIVLTGVRLGAYGRDLEDTSLAGLLPLMELGDYRLRLSSIEPEDVTPALIEALAQSTPLCPHLHLPLQSGSDRVLERMGRHYRREDYRRLVTELREILGELAISTDIIVGFPGESDEDFADTCQLVRDIAFSRLHVFRYSPRPRTAAAGFDSQVSPGTKKERSAYLLELGRDLSRNYHRRYLNDTVEVLVEEADAKGMLSGFTRDYVRVRCEGADELSNQLVRIQVKEVDAQGMWGELFPGARGCR